MPVPCAPFAAPVLTIDVLSSRPLAAEAAASAASSALRVCIGRQGHARIMVGTGDSQLELIGSLVRQPGIDWSHVDVFHLDEFVGLPADHPASARHWLRRQLAGMVQPRSVSYIDGDSSELAAIIQSYSRQLLAAPIDIALVGIGENGHIAFNNPHSADFNDAQVMKRVELDEACRRQQVEKGHFPDFDGVPGEAITVTCSSLFRAIQWICCVPDRRKAQAVKDALEGPLTPRCPGSLLNLHASAAVFLDHESASLLTPEFLRSRCRVHAHNSATPGLVEA